MIAHSSFYSCNFLVLCSCGNNPDCFRAAATTDCISGQNTNSLIHTGVLFHPWPGTFPLPHPWWPPSWYSLPLPSRYLQHKFDRKNTAGIILSSWMTSLTTYFFQKILKMYVLSLIYRSPDINWNFGSSTSLCCWCFKDFIGDYFTLLFQ